MADELVRRAQKFINTYNVPGIPTVAEDGITGWGTMYALTRILQYELNISSLSDNFGPTTLATLASRYPVIDSSSRHAAVNRVIQSGLYCKGYDGGEIDGTYNPRVETAVQKLKSDIGVLGAYPGSGMVPKVFKALLTMDAYVLVPGGTASVRAIQQWMNARYIQRRNFFAIPCDGNFSRDVQKALLFAIQYEIGMSDDVANGVFGPGTQAGIKAHPLSVGSTGPWVQLFSAAMVFNRRPDAAFSASFDQSLSNRVRDFQEFVKLPVTGQGDFQTWASLLVSTGDPSRRGSACDCVTEITPQRAATLYQAGYRTVGRYLSNVPGTQLNKKIQPGELAAIAAGGLRVFPIYQTWGGSASYFSIGQGASDALAAVDWARYHGFRPGTRIYFAVDFDALDSQVTSNIIPHFQGIKSTMSEYGSEYRIGIYGPRNVCSRVAAAGLTTASFVSDMSSGFSGNLGYPMPADWAFDQISTITIGSGVGQIQIDNNIASGLDTGQNSFSPVLPVQNLDVDFDLSLRAAMLADVQQFLTSKGIPETGAGGLAPEDAVQIHPTTYALDIILKYDNLLTGLSRALKMRKALIAVPILWEVRKFTVLDVLADDGVVRYHTGTHFDPTDKYIKNDSSTGLGQIFAKYAIEARNFVISKGLITGAIMNPQSDADLWAIWQKLHKDDVFNISTAAHVLIQKADLLNILLPNLDYSDEHSRLVLKYYQGDNAKAEADSHIKLGLYRVLEKYYAPLRNL